MSTRRQIQKRGSLKSSFTPAANPLKSRGFGKGIQARSAQLPKTNPLQTRPFGSPISASAQQEETESVSEQLEIESRLGYNGLDVPVNAPATPPPPVQRQVNSGGSENNSQPQAVPEVDTASETVEETVQREELFEEETPPKQESPNTEEEGEGVAKTVQPEAESGEEQPQKPFLQAQLEKASKFGYNGLNVPVYAPSTPPPRVQRKLTLSNSENEYQPKVIERANPVLNGLNQFKVQRLCDECEAELAEKEDKQPVQAKLELGQPGDKYEQEADTVAAQVVEKINTPQPQQPVQRQSDTGGASVTEDVEQGIQQAGVVNRKLDDESQTQKSNQPTPDTTTQPTETPTAATNALQNTTQPTSDPNPEPAYPADSQQATSSVQPPLPVVDDLPLPNPVGSEGNQASAVTGDIGNVASEKTTGTEPSGNSPHGELSNQVADLQADAKPSDNLPQPIPENAGNPAYLNSEATEAEPPQDLPEISEPALPESPDLAQAAQQIMQKAEVEKAALSQTAEAKHNALMQQAEATAKTIEVTTQGKVQAILAELDSKKAGVKQTISTTKASIKAQITNQKMLAQAEGTKSLGALRKEVETKRKAAVDASETEAKQTEQTGQKEAKRVMSSSAESSARVHAIANQKANSSSSKAKVQSTVRQAVGQTATDVTGKMRQRSQDLAKNAQEASQKTAKGLRDAGKQLASGIGNNTTQVEKAIQNGTKATVNQIANQEVLSQQKLDALQAKALTSLEKLKASSIADVKQSGQMAAVAARKTGQTSATQINKAKAASLQQLDKGVNQVVGQLNQVPAGRKVNKKAVDQLVKEAGSKLQQANTQLGAMISEQATSSQNSLNQLGVALPGHLDSTHQKVTTEANKATTGLNSGLAGVPTQIVQASQQAITENKNTNQQAVQQFGDGLQQQIDKAKQGWSQEKEKVSNDIRGKIDEGVKSNKDVESKAPGDFTELANTAAAKAEESLVSKIFSGIWEGIKKVAIGLAIFVAVVLVITAAVLIVAAIASITVVASKVLLVVAAIVGVGFLLYGLITAFIKRTDDFWKTYGTNIPWYAQVGGFFAVLGLSIGDAVGITPIIEGIVGKEAFTGKEFTPEQRAEKITEGVLMTALMVIMGKVLKSPGKPGKVPPGEIKSGKIKPGEIKPGEVKPGEVKPGEVKPGDKPVPVEPGVKARRTTVDGHHEIKVTERGTIRCSPNCGAVQDAYPRELEQSPDLQKRLNKAKEKEATDPEAVADEVKAIDAELAAVRRANLTKAKAESRGTIETIKRLLSDKENTDKLSGEDKGSFGERQRQIEKDWNDTSEFADKAKGDPDLEGLALEEFESITQRAKELEADIQKKLPKGAEEPPYVKENRPPLDEETFLADSGTYSRTGKKFQGREIYRDGDGRYYHVDNFHEGRGSEIEYYNAQGKHLGTKNPDGTPKDGPVKGRTLSDD